MVCATCGKECLPNDRFCSYCGALQALAPVSDSDARTAGVAAAPAPLVDPVAPALSYGVPPPPAAGPPLPPLHAAAGQDDDDSAIRPRAQPAPYASFLSSMLTATVCASIALFLLVQAAAMGFTATVYWTAGSLLGVACVVGKLGVDKFQIIRSHPDTGGVRGLAIATVCVAAMFLLVAGILGYRLGAVRAEFKAVTSDWAHLTDVDERISNRRDQVGEGIPSILATYQAITPDVTELQATTARLLKEEEQYRQDYPEYQTQAEKEIADLHTIEQRTKLLQQEVDIATKMSSQDERQRAVTWRNEMVPLLDQEIALARHD